MRRIVLTLLILALAAPVAAKTIRITEGSSSADVVFYRVYWTPVAEPVSIAGQAADMPPGAMSLDMETAPEMSTLDGVYNFGLVAVDDSGKESTILDLGSADVDHVPPDPPVSALIED